MTEKKHERLGKALDLAKQIQKSMPPPKPKRDQRILVNWSTAEYERISAYAAEREDEPLAVTVRNLTLAALDALGK